MLGIILMHPGVFMPCESSKNGFEGQGEVADMWKAGLRGGCEFENWLRTIRRLLDDATLARGSLG
jgi:hypothetical protein